MHCRRPNGFSLVELAVVLAILGLLAGGIIGGQSMIRSMKVKTVLVDANKYADAMKQFKDQYGYLPGDFPAAVKVWGKADGNTNLDTNCNPAGTASPNGITTCNGDGDGVIRGSGTTANTELFENFRAWQHLAAGGFITGIYTGITGPAVSYHVILGTNAPKGPLDNTGFFIWSWANVLADNGTFFVGDHDSAMTFGTNVADSWPSAPALLPREAQDLDRKVDDGVPGMGAVRALLPVANGCATTAVASTAAYAVTATSAACSLLFMQSFRNKSEL